MRTPDGAELAVDIHYTPTSILTVNLVVVGDASSKSLLTPIMDEIGKLAIYRGDYAVIDYTLAQTDRLSDGNYAIDDSDRKHRSLALRPRPEPAKERVTAKKPKKSK